MGRAIELRGVTKSFKDATALVDFTLLVRASGVTVVLGPNGAGKTTALRIVTGAIPPDGGTVTVFGSDPATSGEAVRSRIGIVTAKPALYERLSGRDNLRYAAALYGVGNDRAARIQQGAERFGIADALDRMVGGYSTGMRTRLALARAMVHDPDVLLLDEPTSGLDPESSRAVLGLIRELAADGRTVLMCTHLLGEAEGIADDIVIVDSGRHLVQGSQTELVERYWPTTTVRFEAENTDGLDLLESLPGVRTLRRREGDDSEDNRATAVVDIDDEGVIPDLVATLTARGVRLTAVARVVPSLEDLYFRVRHENGHRP